jgi:hypothetical protein
LDKDRGSELTGNPVRPPKDVLLQELILGSGASSSNWFSRHQVFENPIRQTLRFLGHDHERDFGAAPARKVASQTVQSDPAWSLPAPTGPRMRAIYVFRNEHGVESPQLIAHRRGVLRFPPSSIEGSVANVFKIGMKGNGDARGGYIGSVDPTIRLKVLLPWESEGRNALLAYVADQVTGGDIDPSSVVSAFQELYGHLLPTEAPEGWTFRTPEPFCVSEPGAVDVEIGVEARSPGRTLLAVEADDKDSPDEDIVCSELLDLEVTEEGDLLLHLDTEPAEAGPALALG